MFFLLSCITNHFGVNLPVSKMDVYSLEDDDCNDMFITQEVNNSGGGVLPIDQGDEEGRLFDFGEISKAVELEGATCSGPIYSDINKIQGMIL